MALNSKECFKQHICITFLIDSYNVFWSYSFQLVVLNPPKTIQLHNPQLKKIPEIKICVVYLLWVWGQYKKIVLPRTKPLKNNKSLFFRNHNLSIASQLDMVSHILVEWWLAWSCGGNNSYWQLMNERVLSCLKTKFLSKSLWTLAPTIFPTTLCLGPLKLGVRFVISCFWLSHSTDTYSVLWLVDHNAEIDHWIKKILWWDRRAILIYLW